MKYLLFALLMVFGTYSHSTILECKFDDYFRYYIDHEQKVITERKVTTQSIPEVSKRLKTISWFRDQILVEPTRDNEPVVMISSMTGETLKRRRIVFDRVSGDVRWVFDGGSGAFHLGICETLSTKY